MIAPTIIALVLASAPPPPPPPEILDYGIVCSIFDDQGSPHIFTGTLRETGGERLASISSTSPRFPTAPANSRSVNLYAGEVEQTVSRDGFEYTYVFDLSGPNQTNGVMTISMQRSGENELEYVGAGLCDVVSTKASVQ